MPLEEKPPLFNREKNPIWGIFRSGEDYLLIPNPGKNLFRLFSRKIAQKESISFLSGTTHRRGVHTPTNEQACPTFKTPINGTLYPSKKGGIFHDDANGLWLFNPYQTWNMGMLQQSMENREIGV
jgi:hypothetical protein